MRRMSRYCAILYLALYCVGFSKCAEISVGGSEYIKFDLLGTNTSIYGSSDSLSLRFKTVHPHGLLFYAHGVGYITLELYHCKLRYTINMAEEFSFFFGDELCDNEWHNVRITRDKHKLTVHLDNQPTKVVNIKLSKRFEAYTKLRINVRIYVGGTWKRKNELGKKIVGNFVGCLSDVLFNAYHFISDAQAKKKGYTTGGAISYTCPEKTYKPIGFPNEYAYLRFPSSDRDRVSVQFKFRTYDENGILMYRDGSKISVWLYLKNGKLKFECYIPGKKTFTIDTDTWMHDTSFNDGEWHSVKASLDSANMIFRVDNGSREITAKVHAEYLGHTTSLDFENFTYVGGGTYHKEMYGFVGCMKDLRVNGRKIYVTKIPKVATAVNVDLGKCSFGSLCHPSPCQYQSRCEQQSNNFTCHCKSFYSGRFCQVPMFQATCQGYKDLGMKEDAYCRLDPDGQGPLQEFRVLCNMTESKDAVTIVNHTISSRQVKIREEAYTYVFSTKSWAHKLNYYGVDFKNLRTLIDESDHCRQYVEFNCINTKFLTDGENNMAGAFWASENGQERHYWGGAMHGGMTCACGTTLSCYDKKKTCNCDTDDGVWRQDAGYLTDKDHLPVALLFFPKSAENSNFTVGPLECFGRRKTQRRESEEQKFFGMACQPLVTKPPPVFPSQQNQVSTTVRPKQSTFNTTMSSSARSANLTRVRPTSDGFKNASSSGDNNYTYTIFNETSFKNDTFIPTSKSTVKYANSFVSHGNPTDHILVDVANVQNKGEARNEHWWFILIVTASSFLVIVIFVFLVLVYRHKKKNGFWFKGLFMFTKEAQLPKIEIYRHSLATDTPDILHMEDFKNTKVVDVHFHHGHFVAKKTSAKKKKTVTFKDRC